MSEPFTVYGSEHTVGDPTCCPNWGTLETHPDCGGLVHHQYVDEGWDYIAYAHRCDRCGEDVYVRD